VTLEVDRSALVMSLPVVAGLPETSHAFVPGAGPSDDEAEGVEWRIEHDVLGRETRVATRYGGTYAGLHDAVITDDYRGELGISTVDPAIGWARGSSSFEIAWPEASVRTESTLSVRSDHDRFEVEIELVVHHDGAEIARRRWESSFDR
jgi:hypothetical protein